MNSHYLMASPRVPFAPLNESRLQSLTSIKNRQTALAPPLSSTSSKRKATTYESDLDTENIDPSLYTTKKSKTTPSTTKIYKPVSHTLKQTPRPRPLLTARTPIAKPAPLASNTPLSAPAGRSPTRKRAGLLSRRKTASPYTRIDPPSTPSTSTPAPSGLGFSISAALSSTVPTTSAAPKTTGKDKSSWQFAIYEDTPEELATNLMEHSTCVLDISSDEESEARVRDKRGKENVPPTEGDVSQTSSMNRVAARRERDLKEEEGMVCDRVALREMDAKAFWGEKGEGVFLVEEEEVDGVQAAVVRGSEEESVLSDVRIEKLMEKIDTDNSPARLVEPLPKAEDGFEVWESGDE